MNLSKWRAQTKNNKIARRREGGNTPITAKSDKMQDFWWSIFVLRKDEPGS